MNRPNTDANTTIAFLTLLLTHYLTKGTRTTVDSLIIRINWSDDHTKVSPPESWTVPPARTELKNCGTVPARLRGASGSQAWRCSD